MPTYKSPYPALFCIAPIALYITGMLIMERNYDEYDNNVMATIERIMFYSYYFLWLPVAIIAVLLPIDKTLKRGRDFAFSISAFYVTLLFLLIAVWTRINMLSWILAMMGAIMLSLIVLSWDIIESIKTKEE